VTGVAIRPVSAVTSGHHGLALRAPWYVCVRGEFDRFDERALAPEIQKYDTADLVQRLLADPRNSLPFGEEDQWTVPVRRPIARTDTGRMQFTTHTFARMDLLKLFQASHERFYAVVVEVFCDAPGLPRLAPEEGLTLTLVMRRRTLSLDMPDKEIRRMARDVLRHKAESRRPPLPLPPAAEAAGTQAWMTDGQGGQGWVDVDENGHPIPDRGEGPLPESDEWLPDRDAAGALDLDSALTEQAFSMWRIPPPSHACPAAASRSLWFGLVPTYSGEHETAFSPSLLVTTTPGAPKLDALATYEIRCRAARTASPNPSCPPPAYVSAPTEPFMLAPFFDPEGTKNRTVSITAPDLGALAARAGQPAGPGGIAITTPRGSQTAFDPDNGAPSNPSGPGGTTARTCTFALELFMIVAFFVFNLFLPVVVFLFQLWWLLLLRFCLPPSETALAVLKAHFRSGKNIGDLPARAPKPPPGKPRGADLEQFDELLGAPGLGARLGGAGFLPAQAEALIDAMDPDNRVKPTRPNAFSLPPDPLCSDHADRNPL
jgi:hypothetical protein